MRLPIRILIFLEDFADEYPFVLSEFYMIEIDYKKKKAAGGWTPWRILGPFFECFAILNQDKIRKKIIF